ncbi:MAG: SRPBCC family protein [Gammaproteobacteria bacterium]|nr:SRPBCC family protein [Gammaproteobacteria bacterium]MBT8111679.1 SRPBCC family protein [Gammaproteobacteria bacterium]NNL46377.1 SRPBCC family protein [Woeseiaceae bacterium]
MKFVKVLLIIIIVLVAAFLVGGMLLPSGQYVERSAIVKADQAEVFAMVSDYRQFNQWSPWAALDPEAEYEFSGPATGVGSKMVWRSNHPNVGNGTQEIVEVQPDTMVKSQLMFDGFDTPSYATFTLIRTDNGTRVTWAFDANMDTMLGRYMGLMMDKWVGGDYERGLARLKELAEKAD